VDTCPHCDSPVKPTDAACPVCKYERLPDRLPVSPFAQPSLELPDGGRLYTEAAQLHHFHTTVRTVVVVRWVLVLLLHVVAPLLVLFVLAADVQSEYTTDSGVIIVYMLFYTAPVLLLAGLMALLVFSLVRRRATLALAFVLGIELVFGLFALMQLGSSTGLATVLFWLQLALVVASVVFCSVALSRLARLEELERLAARHDDGGLFGPID
jgi:hypothetical protein